MRPPMHIRYPVYLIMLVTAWVVCSGSADCGEPARPLKRRERVSPGSFRFELLSRPARRRRQFHLRLRRSEPVETLVAEQLLS